MSKVKAIQTTYKGYKFRSRLEARYAVFFDVIGFRWEYEPEGYDLGEHGNYLPDFYLPDFNCWIEIKGTHPSKEELKKCMALSGSLFGKNDASDAILTCNPRVVLDVAKLLEKEGLNNKLVLEEKVSSRGKVYLFYGLLEAGYLALDDCSVEVIPKDVFEFFLFFKKDKRRVKVKLPKPFDPRSIFQACVNKARSARFEFGETPE